MRFARFCFLVYVILEFICVVIAGREIGFFPLFVEVIASALIGAALLLNLRFSFMEILEDFVKGNTKIRDFIYGNFAKIFGAFLLILPGILSDIIGIILLVCAFVFLKSKKDNRYSQDEIIDVEVDPIQEEDFSKNSHSYQDSQNSGER